MGAFQVISRIYTASTHLIYVFILLQAGLACNQGFWPIWMTGPQPTIVPGFPQMLNLNAEDTRHAKYVWVADIFNTRRRGIGALLESIRPSAAPQSIR
jgi:hypothetical protein